MPQALLILLCYSMVGGGIGALARGRQGATVGVIIGALLAPLALILFWAMVFSARGPV